MIKDHKHVLVSALVNKSFDSNKHLKDWLSRIISGIGMQLADLGDGQQNPVAFYCNDNGNTGFTGSAILTTSHCAMHMWDEIKPYKLELDVYSCSKLNVWDVIPFIEELEPISMEHKTIDRSNGLELVEEWY